MRLLPVAALVGRLVTLFALLMLVPMGFAWFDHDRGEEAFMVSTLVTLLSGAVITLLTRSHRRELLPRDGFILVAMTWLALPVFGALPLWLAVPDLSPTDAYFEAMSASSPA